jgi:DNA primase
MRIPDSIIDEIRSASDIVDVVSVYVPLKKRGKNYVGLCPFHQEKTPSFSVSSDKQMFYCFGCSKGGNVFTFVMEHDKVSFAEAVRTLAKRAGIAVPEETYEDSVQATENEKLYTACRTAAGYFADNLFASVEGKLALEYFKHRGFSEESIRLFSLGYSLNAWDGLAKHIEQAKLDLENFERAGLIMKRDDGSGFYDRFRGRAMFPFYSPSGRVVAFGARKLKQDDPLGKYINSPETAIFDKSKNLYGLFQAREAMRAEEFAVLVEGYADLISVYQAGIQNVVASSGTALTDGQIKLIGRYTKNITLVYDADSAGSKATLRGVDLIIENGLDVKVVQLPEGDDPDSFVRKNGGEAFRKVLSGAASFLDFKANFFRGQGLLSTPEGKTKAVRSIVETLARMKDELKRTFYLKSVAEKYDLYESVLFREVEKILGKESARVRYVQRRDEVAPIPPENPLPPAPDLPPLPPPAEQDLIRVMLLHQSEAVTFILGQITAEHFTHPLSRSALDLILAQRGDSWDPAVLMDGIRDPALKNFIAGLLASRYEISKRWASMGSEPEDPDAKKIAEDAIIRLRTQELDRRIEDAYRRMKGAESRGEPVIDIQQEVVALQKEKLRVKTSRLPQ